MLGSEWLYGAIVVLVGLHILTMLYAYRRQSEPSGGATQFDPEQTTPTSDDEEGTVSCANCGTRNQSGYQFCRACAADLSSGRPHPHPAEHSKTY